MVKRGSIHQLLRLMCVGGMVALSSNALAAAFQLYEQDGATVGDYHAGRAAQANDASTTFYNPAGLVHMKNQQLVIGDVGVFSDLKYRGTDSVFLKPVNYPTAIPIASAQNTNIVAQGGAFSQIPNFYYALPITPSIGLGLSLNAPFGLRTVYGRDTALRYAATKSDIEVVDLSPAIGVRVYKGLSLGAGFDMQRMAAEFDQMAMAGTGTDSYSTNKGWSTAYGFHLGALYELPFASETRIGLTYNSQIVHHIRGTSRFTGPLANLALDIPLGEPATIYSGEANAHLTLPPYTTLSGFHQVNPKWAVMGSVIYTQWSVIQNLTLQDIAAADALLTPFGIMPVPSTTVTVNLPTHYRNAWNFSVGSEYYVNDKVTLRGGVGYDQTPVKNYYRDVRIPDSNRYAIALGTHFQATKTIGVDLGWTHLFMVGQARINPPVETTGGQVVQTNGNLQGSADVFGAQLTWDIV
jgi:long-chain fatty acid transport protein